MTRMKVAVPASPQDTRRPPSGTRSGAGARAGAAERPAPCARARAHTRRWPRAWDDPHARGITQARPAAARAPGALLLRLSRAANPSGPQFAIYPSGRNSTSTCGVKPRPARRLAAGPDQRLLDTGTHRASIPDTFHFSLRALSQFGLFKPRAGGRRPAALSGGPAALAPARVFISPLPAPVRGVRRPGRGRRAARVSAF